MSRPLDRDDEMDAVLKRALRRSASGPAADCPDADVLGAFVEGRLRPIERSTVEAHAADCGRCQAVIAALVRTEHVAGAAATPRAGASGWRWLPAPAWLAPTAAIALVCVAAAAVFVVWRTTDQAPEQQAVRFEAAEPVTIPPARSSPAEARGVSPAAPADALEQLAAGRDSRQSDLPSRAPRRPDTSEGAAVSGLAPVPALPDTGVSGRRDAADLEKRLADAPAATPPAAAPSAAPPPATAAAEPSAAPPPGTVEPNRSQTVAVQAAAAKASADAAGQERLQYLTDSAMSRAGGTRNELAAPRRVLTPDPQKLWMLGPSSTVMRSIDGGKTFQPQMVNATTPLVAASAPSPDVCWIVGEQGTVLLTTDGRTWRRVDVPEPTALLSVQATSGLDAVVTAADGRRWITSDGGRTWRQRPAPAP